MFNYEFVKQYFEDNDCELLDSEYKGSQINVKYRCKCGDINFIRFADFKRGRRCKKCGYKKVAEAEKLNYEDVKQYFLDNNCEILETEYINYKTKIKYKCECGRIDYKSFGNFKQGQRCQECALKKVSGENSPHWNPNLTDGERKANQGRYCDPLYREWRAVVKKRDSYICQKCGDRNYKGRGKAVKINAHHKNGWNLFPEDRYRVSNGVSWCSECHDEFHKRYGRGNNTEYEYYEFMGFDNL